MMLYGATQARAHGLYAAKCMSGRADPLELGLLFELFSHVTRFCGQKVVLLGLYNGQRLDEEPPEDIVTYARTLGSKASGSFARVLLLRGRLQVTSYCGGPSHDLDRFLDTFMLSA